MSVAAALPAPAGANVHVVRLRPASPPSARSTWFLSPAVFLIAAIATFFISYIRTSSAAANTPRISPLLDPRSTALDLRVETQGAGLRLSWNRFSPAVVGAKSGLLEIDDAGQHRKIALDRNQIVNGSVVYRPASDDVSFRLNLHATQGPDIAQVLRVLDASPRLPALQAVVPDNSDKKEPARAARREVLAEARSTFTPRIPPSAAQPTTAITEQKTAPVQSAVVQPPTVTVAQSAPPLPAAETALPKPAAPQSQKSLAVPKSVESPQPNPQSNVGPAADASSAPIKQVPLPAYVPPRPIKWVEPDQRLLGQSNPVLPIDIRVKVKIDETGHVTAAHALIDGGKRDKKLMAAAAAAVRQWVFEPAKAHGVNVATEEIIVIHLGPESQ